MRRRPVPPPSGTGKYVRGGVIEAISEQEKAGRPVPPPITLLNPLSPSLPGSTATYHDELHPDIWRGRMGIPAADPFIRRPGAVAPAAGRLPDVPPAVIELVPESVARENLVLPLALAGETLTVAAANAGDLLLADKLSFILTKKVRLVPAPRDAVIEAINQHYGRSETESVDSMLVEFTDTGLDTTDFDLDDDFDPNELNERAAARTRSPAEKVAALVRRVESDRARTFPDGPSSPEGGMFFYTVPEGQRALRTRKDGRIDVIVGPARVWHGSSRFEPMKHYVAHPGEYLTVRYRDGRQDHLSGPAEVWFDPRTHLSVGRQEALQVSAKEAVVVYARADDGRASRRLVYGPTLFVPAPGEWLHTFSWHGSDGGSVGTAKVAKGLVFQKLWLMPDQMYHDVPDVRTADDAVLTVKLMIFFELLDIDRMLDATHDPIGDFINAATSDVVAFTGRRTFEQFKRDTGALNEPDAYAQLAARAAQTGYRINKVVYRGYGAPARLQAMHDQAIEARTKLDLDRATEQQAQELEDFKLNAQMHRAARRRTEQATEVDAELDLARRRQEAERDSSRKAAEVQQEVRRAADGRQRDHLAALKEMGVDLTAYLTQARADRVIELRGAKNGTHVHLDGRGGQ